MVIFVESLDILKVCLFIKEIIQLGSVIDLKLHEPAFVFRPDRDLLWLVLEHLVDLGDFTVAWHVDIGGCLNTFNGTLNKGIKIS